MPEVAIGDFEIVIMDIADCNRVILQLAVFP